jgi:hypothetical protein
MTEDIGEIVVTLNFKRFIALSLIAIITIISVGSYVIALLAFKSPSYELRWASNIIQFEYFTTPTLTFNPGDQVTIVSETIESGSYWEASVYNSWVDQINAKWIVIVKDQNNLPVHFASGALTTVSGNFTLPNIDFNLPSDAINGPYTARLMFWTNWLPAGDSRTLAVDTASFTVVP